LQPEGRNLLHLLAALCGVVAFASFSGFAIGVQAVNDVTTVRDDRATWNTARPVIEDALASLAVASLATALLVMLAVLTAVLWLRARTTRTQRSAAAMTGLLLMTIGAAMWWNGAHAVGGFATLVDDVNAGDALPVFEDYDLYLDAWGSETTALLVLSAGALAALFGTIRMLRGQSPPPEPEELDPPPTGPTGVPVDLWWVPR
jgi:hypothetical protein